MASACLRVARVLGYLPQQNQNIAEHTEQRAEPVRLQDARYPFLQCDLPSHSKGRGKAKIENDFNCTVGIFHKLMQQVLEEGDFIATPLNDGGLAVHNASYGIHVDFPNDSALSPDQHLSQLLDAVNVLESIDYFIIDNWGIIVSHESMLVKTFAYDPSSEHEQRPKNISIYEPERTQNGRMTADEFMRVADWFIQFIRECYTNKATYFNLGLKVEKESPSTLRLRSRVSNRCAVADNLPSQMPTSFRLAALQKKSKNPLLDPDFRHAYETCILDSLHFTERIDLALKSLIDPVIEHESKWKALNAEMKRLGFRTIETRNTPDRCTTVTFIHPALHDTVQVKMTGFHIMTEAGMNPVFTPVFSDMEGIENAVEEVRKQRKPSIFAQPQASHIADLATLRL